MKRAHASPSVSLVALPGIGAIRPGDDLVAIVVAALARAGRSLVRGDVLVVCQKAVSKAEGRIVRISTVKPSAFARRIASTLGKDPRVIEVVLGESRRIVRMSENALICETHHGFVCANAGVDSSNPVRSGTVTLLPVDPDASAAALRAALGRHLGVRPAVVISDTFGRPFREGQVDVAIGVAGIRAWRSLSGERDWSGRPLSASAPAEADMLAAAAGLVVRKNGGEPVVLISGFSHRGGRGSARDLVRPRSVDLFR